MADILIVGAGVSGLATAWFLQQRGHHVRVVEAAAQPGGCLRTFRENGFLVDAGPTSTLFRGGALAELARGIGIDNELLEANRASRTRYIVKDRRLVALPDNPLSFLRTPLFSPRGKLRLLLEPLYGRAVEEESVAQFVRRRLGSEFLDWGIDPFVSGVYAGDPAKLSARAATAKVYALEAEYRSLFIGALFRLLQGRASGPAPAGRLVAMRMGMQTLAEALAAAVRQVRYVHAVTELAPRPEGGWLVHADATDHWADHVVLATPAYRAADIVRPLDSRLAALLSAVYYPPVASVALGFDGHQILHPLDGFGTLIPSRLQYQTLGALFSSTVFPGRAPEGRVLLTAFIGGARNPGVLDRDDTMLIDQVKADIGPLLGIRGDPVYARVTLWEKAIPQYELGHLDRLAQIDARLARWPGLHLRANWREGISVSDCVQNAHALATLIGPA